MYLYLFYQTIMKNSVNLNSIKLVSQWHSYQKNVLYRKQQNTLITCVHSDTRHEI